MKVYYYCEKCGKSFDSEKEALNCENEHKIKEEKRKKLEKEKKSRLEAINELLNSYVQDYNEFPEVNIECEKTSPSGVFMSKHYYFR